MSIKAVTLTRALVIDLDDKLQRDALRFALQCGSTESAGPGAKGVYHQLETWLDQVERVRT